MQPATTAKDTKNYLCMIKILLKQKQPPNIEACLLIARASPIMHVSLPPSASQTFVFLAALAVPLAPRTGARNLRVYRTPASASFRPQPGRARAVKVAVHPRASHKHVLYSGSRSVCVLACLLSFFRARSQPPALKRHTIAFAYFPRARLVCSQPPLSLSASLWLSIATGYFPLIFVPIYYSCCIAAQPQAGRPPCVLRLGRA